MIWVWRGPDSRPTKDIDLLGRIDNDLELIKTNIREICLIDVKADGIVFEPESVTTIRIKEDAEYEGVRARIKANLGNARISLQIDVGFGDVVVPAPSNIMYPGILDFPTPEIKGYTMESLIAEKFEAMVKLGMLNSRMKDFYDVWILSRNFNFEKATLAKAIRTTFKNRGAEIIESPKVFEPSFWEDETKQI